MTYYRLPDHLGLCEVDGHLLMLDLRRDLYLLLDAYSAASFRRWRDTQGDSSDDPGLARLAGRGMLVHSDKPGLQGWTDRRAPLRSLLDLGPPSGRSWPLAPEVAACLWGARRHLKRGLEAAVTALREAGTHSIGRDPAPFLAPYLAARRLVPVAPNCLTDSLAMALFLGRRGISCELVFGVKLDPFAAHCWLQIGDAVVNDAADNVAAFTPILVA